MNKKQKSSIAQPIRDIYEKGIKFEVKLFDVNPKELSILRTVKEVGSINLKDLTERTGLPLSTCGWIADKMVKNKQLVRRQDSNDRRAINLSLTSEGAVIIEGYEAIFDTISEVALGLLTEDERELAVKLIAKISELFPE
jgi:DNA-binding MarR family transcriptional regulator